MTELETIQHKKTKRKYTKKHPNKIYPLVPFIDEEATITQLGYSSTSVSPGGNKRVVCHCEICGKEIIRARGKIKLPIKCINCAHTIPDDLKKRYPLVDYIDEAATIARFGYSSTLVGLHSPRHVISHCEICGVEVCRSRYATYPPIKCYNCSRTKRTYENPIPFVDDAATFEKFGYTISNLTRFSERPVIGICSMCKKQFKIAMCSVREEQLCRSCINIRRWEHTSKPREKDGSRHLNETETLGQHGYSAIALSPKSEKKVIVTCPKCNVTYSRSRRYIYDDWCCTLCARQRIDYKALRKKAKQTMIERYPDGLPPKHFGKVVSNLAEYLENILDRKLIKEKLLGNGGVKRIDLYDEKSQVGIEYNGLHWHHENSPEPRPRSYHYQKMRAANAQGIRLVTIFEDEYLQHEDAVKARLLSILGNNTESIGARECKVKEVEVAKAKEFLNTYHIQGAGLSVLCAFGLYHDDELIGLISGGKHHRQGHNDCLVLTRLCFAGTKKVVGGSERLFKYLKNYAVKNGFKYIITWSDNRWTKGNVYERLGMINVADLPPDYSYVKMQCPRERVSKQSQKKSSTGCPPDITERDWALQHGLSRIWDCGHKRWEFLLS